MSAMRQQLWEEAKSLAQLAEAYSRIAARHDRHVKRAEIALEDIPLEWVKAIALDEDGCATNRLAIYGEVNPPQAKKDYWKVESERAAQAQKLKMMMLHDDAEKCRRIKALEAEVEALRSLRQT